MARKVIKSESWRWFKDELARLLGDDEAQALFAELTRRRRLEYNETQRRHAERELRYYEAELAERRAQGRPTMRIELAIARRRQLLGLDETSNEA